MLNSKYGTIISKHTENEQTKQQTKQRNLNHINTQKLQEQQKQIVSKNNDRDKHTTKRNHKHNKRTNQERKQLRETTQLARETNKSKRQTKTKII